MLLAVDIGNSFTKLGVFDHDRLIDKAATPTVKDADAASFLGSLNGSIRHPIDNSIISSVVPELNDAVIEALSQFTGNAPLLVTNDHDFGLTIYHHPIADIGSDRLVNAFSATEKYGPPLIVCSFGTAVTIDHVNADRVLTGGLIAPGAKAFSKAMHITASRLPEVDVDVPRSLLQTTTIDALRSGVSHGYISMVEGLIEKVKAECDPTSRVIATGGSARLIDQHTNVIDIVDDDLMLDGLRRLFDRLRPNR
jgi:type III pantothenate kinase